ncbi:MAG: hypothetical protein A2079_07415 [Geobacteraceae bacterium GWC2_48_7]|nr:MAG: hypothetical protein A2079_07415 [Geobacteraceae bacterium GWC2_48_7]
MKKMMLVIALFLMTAVVAVPAMAAEIKMVGSISKIEMAADKKSANVTLKDVKTEKEVVIYVTDQETLDKLGDKRIVDGDEIRTKYDDASGKNVSKIFKKTAGC